MTRPNRDPDRRTTPPPHPGFAAKPLDIDLDVCKLCRAIVPATELARTRHAEWDQKIEQLLAMAATMALTADLPRRPGPGSRDYPPPVTAGGASPGPGAQPSGEVGERGSGCATTRHQRHDPTSPDQPGVPTGPQRSDATRPPDGRHFPGDRSGGPNDLDAAEQAAYEQQQAAEGDA